MKKTLNLGIAVMLLFSHAVASSQAVDFNREQLSPKGRMAYDRLLSACIFRVGGVGYSGTTSKEELALHELLEEQSGVEALKSLVVVGTYEGALYGLLGLSLRNNAEFNRAVDVYKARKDRPECQRTGLFEYLNVTGEMVTTQSGCIITAELRTKVVTDLQSGRYDKLISGEYRSRKP
jgi:hypothetical protein